MNKIEFVSEVGPELVELHELTDRELASVSGGGRKAGGGQQEYLVVTLKEVFVSSS